MKVKQLIERLDLTILAGGENLDREITGGYVCDLLSDVMGFASEGNVWITLQTHQNVLGVASLKDLAAVILIKGLQPDAETLNLSNTEGVPLLQTTMSAFETAGRLYQMLNGY